MCIYRILGANTLDTLRGVDINTCFVEETYINDCCNSDNLDIDTLKQKSWKFKKGESTQFEQVTNNTSCIYEGTFHNIDMYVGTNRKGPVYTEKHRLVFYTKLESEVIWVSLLKVLYYNEQFLYYSLPTHSIRGVHLMLSLGF